MKKNYFKSLLASVLATVLVLTNSLCVLADTSVSDGNAGISIASVSDNNAGIATVSTGDATETNGELVWDLSTIGTMAQTTTDFSIGAFKVIANGGVQIDAVSDVASDSGKSFEYCLNTKGSGNTGKRAVSFTVDSSVKLNVWARSGGDGDRYLAVVNSAGTEVATITAVGKANTVLSATPIELSADTYYIYSKGSGINIYDIEIETNLNLDLTDVATGEYTTNVAVGDFTILAESGKQIAIDSVSVTSDNGEVYTKALNLKGNGNTSRRAIQFTLAVADEINVYALSGSDSAVRTLNVVDANGTSVATIDAAVKGDFVSAATVSLEAGTYTIYSKSGGINIYDIVTKPADVEKTPWADVPTPSITHVSTDAEGNIVVEFDASIDKNLGAEKVTVVMLENGFEFASKEVKSVLQTSVSFTPIWSGDYTFKVIAHRSGEADKVSAEYAYNGYVLPVKKPIVEMSQNRGNGVVYLDWINVEAADTYNVYYKLDSASDYTTYVTDSADAHAEITGLTVDTVYDFKIEAVRNSDNFVATYEFSDFTVTSEAEQLWYFATVGSAQETHATVTDASDNVLQQVDMATKDETVNKVGITPATVDVVNTDNSVSFTATGNGKISDGEEGFQYFYTMIDPNTQNFELTATFELTELYSGETDNQTGYGIIATDMLGYNYYETDGLWIKHKQLNSVSTMVFGKAPFFGQRNISGYVSSDTTSVDDVTRVTEQTGFKNTSATSVVDGSTYTITLKKTNDAYVSVCNGEEISYADLSILSKQEDGSVCIGVFASRKAGIKVTDIQFSTSESTGVVAVEKSEAITPSVAIVSSANVGTNTYELIYHPNIAGKLTVKDNAGNVVYNENIGALEVAKVTVPVTLGKNAITSTLVPDKTQNLTSYNTITKTTNVECQTLQHENNVIYVGPEGSAEGNGTKENPYDLATVVKYAVPGQYIIMLNGTYNCGNITIGRSVSGTEENPICLVAESVNGVVLDSSSLTIVGDYWHVYGLYVLHAGKAGIQISGNNNIVEMCTVEGAGNTGIQISRSGSVDREAGLEYELWPTNNLVKNCTSFDNCDAGRNDADGFAAKLTCGEGNVFYGCIAHNNIDDGWDLFAKAISGEIGAVTIENSIAYNNGWMTYEDTNASGYEYGEGNGFKLGGNDMYGGHKLINSIAFGNIGKGITSNSCPDCEVYNSTSYGNAVGADAAFNLSFATKTSNHKRWIVEGLISLTSHTTTADQIPFSYITADNYIFDGATSHNNAGVEATDAWFKNVDVSIVPTRNADGTINMQGLLEPTADCAADAGARLDTTSARAKSVVPALPGTEAPELPDDDTSTDNNDKPSVNPEDKPSDTPSIKDDVDTDEENDDDSDDNNSSSNEPLDWNNVQSSVNNKVNEVINSNVKGNANVDFVNKGETKVPVSVLNSIQGKKVTVAFHNGSGIALSISGENLRKNNLANLDTIDLTVDSNTNNIPEQVVASKDGVAKQQMTVRNAGVFKVHVNMHIAAGEQNAGKYANLYRYNSVSGKLEYCGSFQIIANGQCMFALRQGGNYLLTVTAVRPHEMLNASTGDYTIQSGDTLSGIASRYGIPAIELFRKNPQLSDMNSIIAGQKLNIN